MSKIIKFDYQFYLNTYLDLKDTIKDKKEAIIHYLRHGISEQRAPSKYVIEWNYNQNLKQVKKENNIFQNNIRFNILIRTSKRPKLFKRCIESILSQTYKNYHVFVCYDTKDSFHYLKKYNGHPKISVFYNCPNGEEKYRFNLNCNVLLDKVNSDFIMFLDDDGMFVGNYALNIMRCNIAPYKLLTWRFLRPDKLIYINDLESDFTLGKIDTSSVCFHHSLKHLSEWDDQQYGDFRFFKPIFSGCPSSLKHKIPYTLTSTQFDDKIGNYGN